MSALCIPSSCPVQTQRLCHRTSAAARLTSITRLTRNLHQSTYAVWRSFAAPCAVVQCPPLISCCSVHVVTSVGVHVDANFSRAFVCNLAY